MAVEWHWKYEQFKVTFVFPSDVAALITDTVTLICQRILYKNKYCQVNYLE